MACMCGSCCWNLEGYGSHILFFSSFFFDLFRNCSAELLELKSFHSRSAQSVEQLWGHFDRAHLSWQLFE
jgi:hypothetical protein